MSEINYEQPQEFDFDFNHLFHSCMEKNWSEVLRVYWNNPLACKAKLTTTEDTALHILVSLNYADITDANEHLECVCELVDSLPRDLAVEILGLKNDKGNTPLHLAAAAGSFLICQNIAGAHHELMTNRNLKGETPMYLAVQHGKIDAFLCLHYYLPSQLNEGAAYSLTRRKDGDTILHSAIAGGYFGKNQAVQTFYILLIWIAFQNDMKLHANNFHHNRTGISDN